MPLFQRRTLTQFLIEERRRFPEASGEFNSVLLDVALACRSIASNVALGALHASNQTAGVNVQGEMQHTLDVESNEAFLRINEWGGHLAAMASEELKDPYQIPQSS